MFNRRSSKFRRVIRNLQRDGAIEAPNRDARGIRRASSFPAPNFEYFKKPEGLRGLSLFSFLSSGFDGSNPHRFTTQSPSNLDLLAGKFSRFLLSGFVEIVDKLVRAIRKDELAILGARQSAGHFIHPRRVLQTAGIVADVTDERFLRSGSRLPCLCNSESWQGQK